uniref:Ubiquitin carboxyl-terminal hydrolase n=1 Tax=Lepeophtheirus salmonis TaxID=72036 RepID=A0A0K2TUS0_LEPSM
MVSLKFSSLEEINKHASELPSINLSKMHMPMLCKSMRKSYDKGVECYNIKMNEDAYICLFRFQSLFQKLQRSNQFRKDKKEYLNIIGGKSIIENAVVLLEKLSKSLQKDYESKTKSVKDIPPVIKEEKFKYRISVNDLKNLKSSKSQRFLLCDVRNSDEYADNSINWKESVNIPPKFICPGIIPKNIEDLLYKEDKKVFANRSLMDYIIIMDNNSKHIEDNDNLKDLKDILLKWECDKVSHNIIICEGGFEKFSMAYPLETTKKTKSIGSKTTNANKIVDIKNLTYPEVDQGENKAVPSPSPPPQSSKSPAFTSGAISFSSSQSENPLPYNRPVPTLNTDYPEDVKGRELKPNVPDRSLKTYLLKDKEDQSNKEVKPKKDYMKNDYAQRSKEVVQDEEKKNVITDFERKKLFSENKQDKENLRISGFGTTINEQKNSSKETFTGDGIHNKYPTRGSNTLNATPFSSNMNRSYSSPNIAELAKKEEEEDEYSPSSLMPKIHVDRSTKPSTQIKRNFDHVWSSGQKKRGLTGLKNLGNTCYMNSILQCISNFTVMAKYFLENKYLNDLNKKSDTKGDIAREYSALLQQMWSGNVKSISPSDMKRVIGKYNSNFSGFDQQDAHEFFLSFMLWLHNDVNEIREKVTLPEQKTENAPSKKAAAKKAWEYELCVDKSFIKQTFYGQRKSTLECPSCHYESSRYDSFMELSLELPPGNRKVTLFECIKLYLEPVHVTWTCSKCKHNGRSIKKFDLVKLPLILTIHLARFFNDGLWRKKQNVVDFDLEHVNFGRYVTTSDEGSLNTLSDFSLYGVCNHFGSMESGHYTAYCYSQVYSKWHKYDDNEVHELDKNNVVTPAAYVLFYAAKN